jgi:glycosyltransferase involved in cell wall biosynthesis
MQEVSAGGTDRNSLRLLAGGTVRMEKMRILQFTGGAAQMYCGSCLRDNALASDLMKLGHQVTLVPLYTPTTTDEQNVSLDKVFFGGISVYLEQNYSVFRHTPWLLDKLWDSQWALKLASKRSVAVNPKFLGEMTISMLKGEHGRLRKEFSKLLAWLETEPRPDVVNLPFALLIALAEPLKRSLERPICLTLQGDDVFLDGLTEPYRSESMRLIRERVVGVDRFIATSNYYADYMCRYFGIAESRMDVVPIGIHTGDFAPGSKNNVFTIGYFARIAPEKGLHLLAEAYRKLRAEHGFGALRLEAAGYLPPEHKPYLETVERQMREWGYGAEFHYRGTLDRQQKADFLGSLDVISVPSPYREPKGLYLLEAMASGVPAVQPAHGSFPEIIQKTGGGLLFEPDNAASLAEQIAVLIRDRERARGMGAAASEAVRRQFTVANMAARTIDAYQRLMQHRTAEVSA